VGITCSQAVKTPMWNPTGNDKKSFSDRSKETLILLYISLVRPQLEYCCQIWNPHFVKDIDLNEAVQ